MPKLKKLSKYIKVGFDKVGNHIKTDIYLKTKLCEPKPLKVYYLISNKCNFKCQMCPQWLWGLQENTKEYLSLEKVKSIIDEMVKLKIGEFGISGGEPLIYKDKVLELLAYANSKKIYTHFVTNGSLLTKEILDSYDQVGGGHVSVSLDGLGQKHDELRGFPGAFTAVEKVLNLFQNNKFNNLNLKINTVLTNNNLDEIIAVVNLAIKNKAMIFIQPFDPYAYGQKNIIYRQNNFPLWVKKENYSKLKQIVDELLALKKKHPTIILNDEKNIIAFYNYFTDENFYTQCFAGLDQIAVMPQGEVSFCKFGEYGDLKITSLKDFLQSQARKKVLQQSLVCQEGCLLGCMFRPSLFSLFSNGFKQLLKLSK